ncbi:MAG TPA: hypothetical protein VFZ79_19380 [Acidimicrobiales bacterium]
MDDQQPRDDEPDPRTEPDAGPAEGGRRSALAASDTADNAETVLDPDREPDEPEIEVRDQVERIERHSRDRPAPDPEGSPQGENPPG